MACLKTEKPKQFQFIPRYYDEQKEDLDNRIKHIKDKVKTEDDGEYKPNIKGQFKRRHEAFYGTPAKSKVKSVSKWMMLIIYAGLVIVIVYLIMSILSKL